MKEGREREGGTRLPLPSLRVQTQAPVALVALMLRERALDLTMGSSSQDYSLPRACLRPPVGLPGPEQVQ